MRYNNTVALSVPVIYVLLVNYVCVHEDEEGAVDDVFVFVFVVVGAGVGVA
jgi:hypothetical protein